MSSMVASEAAAETVWLVAREQSKYWKGVSPKACEPQEGTPISLCDRGSSSLVVDAASFAFSVPGIYASGPYPYRLTVITEILKLHRQYYLYSKHDMMQVPLVGAEIEQRFSAQVMCT
jgi:histone deacetylase 6